MNDRSGAGQPARDAYEILEIRPECSQVVVTAAYRALAALYHPDASGGSSHRMAELNDAYALIRTPELRAVYDQQHNPRAAIPVQSVTEPVAAGPIQAAVAAATASAATAAATATASAPGTSYAEARPAGVIDFGRYEGWTISDLARRDPDYLRWLRRHSSGIRFRAQIDAIFARSESASGDALRRR